MAGGRYHGCRWRMRPSICILAAVFVFAGSGASADLTWGWNSQLSFSQGKAHLTSTLTLHVSASWWDLASRWDLSSPGFSSHSLSLHGSLGPLHCRAGLSFQLASPGVSPLGGTGWAANGLEWTGGFLSLELPLRAITLRLTILAGQHDK